MWHMLVQSFNLALSEIMRGKLQPALGLSTLSCSQVNHDSWASPCSLAIHPQFTKSFRLWLVRDTKGCLLPGLGNNYSDTHHQLTKGKATSFNMLFSDAWKPTKMGGVKTTSARMIEGWIELGFAVLACFSWYTWFLWTLDAEFLRLGG